MSWKDIAPCGFKFSLKTIVLSLQLVLFGKSSLRGTSKSIRCFSEYVNRESPCHTVIGDWLLRYGLYNLQKNKQKRSDWIWVVDHTIDFGVKQAFVVLGVTKEDYRRLKKRRGSFNLSHKDVEVMAIDIVEKTSYETVLECFTKISANSGVPVQIVSDGGGSIKKAIRLFKKNHPSIRVTYDVTHATALILKHELQEDKRWKEFSENVRKTKCSLFHTKLAYLAPPTARDKARYLNLEPMVKWAQKVSKIHKRYIEKELRDKFDEKLSWIKDFEEEIEEWTQILKLMNLVKNDIKTNGLRHGTKLRYKKGSKSIRLKGKNKTQTKRKNKRLNKIKEKLETYIKEQTEGMDKSPNLGCSDIIESLFGSYKFYSAKTPMKEIGKAILTMPALVGEINPLEVKKAMEAISQKKLNKFCKKTFGETLFSKRSKLKFQLKNKKLDEEVNEEAEKIA